MALMAWLWGWTSLAQEKNAAEARLRGMQWAYTALERECAQLRERLEAQQQRAEQLALPAVRELLVLAEQRAAEGSGAGELAQAAICYAAEGTGFQNWVKLGALWPWGEPDWQPRPGARGNLLEAAALMLAAVEETDRRAAFMERFHGRAPAQGAQATPIHDRATIERLFELDCLAEEGGVRHV